MGHEYGKYNFVELNSRFSRKAGFVYVDSPDYLADKLFIKHQIRVDFGREYVKDTWPYALIFCKVRKKDCEAFTEAMADLERKMFLQGRGESYAEFCRSVFYPMLNEE